MLPLGHMGIGRRLVAPWSEGLPVWPIYLGAVLPDLLDKPVYYLSLLLAGRGGPVPGTRTMGHTALLALLVGIIAWIRHSPIVKAISLGMASHLVMDTLGDFFNNFMPGRSLRDGPIGGIAAVIWPALGWHFPDATSPTFAIYAAATFGPANIVCEVVGAVLLYQDWRSQRIARATRS